jgi:hypothetical protein
MRQMPLQSYDHLKHADIAISLETSVPLDGSGSMKFTRNASTGFGRHAWARRNVTGERNMRSGALQYLFKPTGSNFVAGFNRFRWGLIYLVQGNVDITDTTVTSGGFYMAGYDTNGNSGAGSWSIMRFAQDLGDTPTIVQAGPSTPSFSSTNLVAMDVEWRQDTVEIGGVQSILKVAINPSPSDPYASLTEVCNVVDPVGGGALMNASFGEGPGWSHLTTSAVNFTLLVDRARIYESVPL